MSEEEQSGEKSFEPTPKRLEDARKKGEIPKSVDLTTAASYLGFILAALFAAPTESASRNSAHSFQIIAALRANPAPFDGAGTCTSLFSADLVDDDDGASIVSSRTPPCLAFQASTPMRWIAI